jgi:hypothetical protein
MNVSLRLRLFLLTCFTLIVLCSCSPAREKSQWTILVYMAADNSLDEAAMSDIEEMQSAQFSDQVRVIVQIDHRDEYPSSEYTGTERYRVRSGSIDRISKLGEKDSGDYRTMASFFNWGTSVYPAEKYAYVIWSHGNGWYNYFNKFCPDNQSDNAINVADGEFRAAMELVDTKPDILLLDACNMQTMEVLTEIADYADFIIGSEASVPEDGFPYQDILPLWDVHTTTQDLCSDIALNYINSYNPYGSQNPNGSFENRVSCSVVKTKHFSGFVDALGDFVLAEMEQHKIDFIDARDEVSFEFNDLDADVDIKEFLLLYQDITQDPQVEQLLTLLDEAFPAQWLYKHPADYSDLGGSASVWFPRYEDQFTNLYPEYYSMEFSQSGWGSFLTFLFITNSPIL